MTAQANDTIRYRDADYQLTGIKGEGLFTPHDHGIFVRPMHTGCWRGYIVHYAIVDGELQLDRAEMQLMQPPGDASKREAPLLFGKPPATFDASSRANYEALGVRMPFTGGLLLARDFIHEMYVHMGFHPAYKYRTVHELVFDDGRVTNESDQSPVMEQIREKLKGKKLAPGEAASESELMEWIKSTFSREYW